MAWANLISRASPLDDSHFSQLLTRVLEEVECVQEKPSGDALSPWGDGHQRLREVASRVRLMVHWTLLRSFCQTEGLHIRDSTLRSFIENDSPPLTDTPERKTERDVWLHAQEIQESPWTVGFRDPFEGSSWKNFASCGTNGFQCVKEMGNCQVDEWIELGATFLRTGKVSANLCEI